MVASAFINVFIITVLGNIYAYLVNTLVDWENHRYQEDWESSLITKSFAFNFVNCYIALFAVAFHDRSFDGMAIELAIIMIGIKIILTLIGVIIPMCKISNNKRKLKALYKKGFPGKAKTPKELKL